MGAEGTGTRHTEHVVAALVIGTCHEYQRHQDRDEGREKVRADFQNLIRTNIAQRGIDLIAEEAGNDERVWAQLKADEAKTAAFDSLFGGTKATDEPQNTIAKLVAHELLGDNCHIDIRPPGADPLPDDANETLIAERDAAMATRTIEARHLASATSILVICGERHRKGLTKSLGNHGLHVESRRFPE
jgi:hypothetical protein